ncbi:hypothetical protein BESB_045990 [Besnoitia besnoiti]|uniref:Uncharacterized protein n=1 Tax=Besnoitia besnoiti TaxID=94643 RepID=A0A2A9ML99_BESBE|nr:hypothetical protein BESB_045990 [Besnoitia besnoiti]PFH36407.1 hypothetical protein BESB_045990 [Besnoitia besnoiti]
MPWLCDAPQLRRRGLAFWLFSLVFAVALCLLAFRAFSPASPASRLLASSPSVNRRLVSETKNTMQLGATEKLRGFLIAWNPARGYLLLRSEKKSKGLHYQLPGGHAEFPDDAIAAAHFFVEADRAHAAQAAAGPGPAPSSSFSSSPSSSYPFSSSSFVSRLASLLSSSEEAGTAGARGGERKKHVDEEEVARVAAARELFEETGIDVRGELQHLVPLAAAGIGPYKARFYFFLHLTEEMLAAATRAAHNAEDEGDDEEKKTKHAKKERALLQPESDHKQAPLLEVQLAIGLDEHTGFRFVPAVMEAAELVAKHSGGKSTKALQAFADLLNKKTSLSPLQAVAGLEG